MRIDAHQHFWRFDGERQAWITQEMDVLRRDFLPRDLAPLLEGAGLDGCLAVQARQDLEETRWLLALAREQAFVRGVVGWANLRSAELALELAEFTRDPLFKGVRHIVQDEPDDEFLLRPDFQHGVGQLADHGLVYEILIYPRQLPAAVRLAANFPAQAFVLDHLAKPAIRNGEPAARAEWEAPLRELAALPNVACKLSGLVTEAGPGWSEAELRPFLETAFEAFGPERVLFGSDWPVCLLAADYEATTEIVKSFAAELDSNSRAKLFGLNAVRIYGLR